MQKTSAKVVQLRPSAKPIKQEKISIKTVEQKSNKPNKYRAKGLIFLACLLVFFRYVIFFLLRAFKTPIAIICGLAAFSAFVGLPLVYFGYEGGEFRGKFLWYLFGTLIISQAISWFYESLLLKISPDQTNIR